jgi:hypothetical protein
MYDDAQNKGVLEATLTTRQRLAVSCFERTQIVARVS